MAMRMRGYRTRPADGFFHQTDHEETCVLDDFKKFLFRGNVIDLAVAVIIGAAFTGIVTAISEGLLTPLIGMLFSKDISEMFFTLNGSRFYYGLVLDAAISFVLVAAVLFFVVVKPMQVLNERRARGEATDDTPAPSDEAVLLTEIRDLLATRS
jgi:large conductance mechanosensitive channel